MGRLDEVGGDHAEASKEGAGKDDGGTGGGHGCGLSGRRGRRLRDVGRLAGRLGAGGLGHGAGRLRAGRRRLRDGTVGGGERDGGDEAGDNGGGGNGGGGSRGSRRGSGRDGSGVAGRVLRVLNEDGRALVGIEGEGFLGVDDAVLGASSITGLLITLPAGSNTLLGRLAPQVSGTAGADAQGLGVAAEDDVTVHAVVGVGLGAVDGDILGDLLGGSGGEGNASDDES